MEWLTNIGISAAGFPWWAAFIIVLLTVLSTKVVDAVLRLRKAGMEERQYEDGQTKEAREALIAELKNRVDKLECVVEQQETRHREALSAANLRYEETRAAHMKCEVGQAELRGQLAVVNEKIAALERHDKANKEHVDRLRAAVIEEVPKTA